MRGTASARRQVKFEELESTSGEAGVNRRSSALCHHDGHPYSAVGRRFFHPLDKHRTGRSLDAKVAIDSLLLLSKYSDRAIWWAVMRRNEVGQEG